MAILRRRDDQLPHCVVERLKAHRLPGVLRARRVYLLLGELKPEELSHALEANFRVTPSTPEDDLYAMHALAHWRHG